jgi:hypothetical protein
VSVRTLFALSCCLVLCVAPAKASVDSDRSAQTKASCPTSHRSFTAYSGVSSASSFHDYIEDTRGPDICAENRVANDNEGMVTFGLHIHNRSGFAPTDAYGVFLDTDLNPATGGGGADYRVRLTSEATILGKWDGTHWAPQATLEPATWLPTFGPIFRVKAADLGGTQGFSFLFFSTDGTNVDYAPNRGMWSYQFAPLELHVRGMALDRARAGRAFSARMAVLRGDLDAPLAEGEIACAAKVGTRALTGTGRFAGGRAVCTWRLPRSTRGKRLSGSVAVTFQGVEAKRSYATVVR